jgi:hypothetical protein
MKSHFDRYFELLPALLITLLLILADEARHALREPALVPIQMGAPELILEAPKLILR